ncbi:MAG TPA: hypothetical protein VL595_19140 [Pseudonocardia sp.]|jgi:hypothetical protein|nr:hypothetical protein [Pseudonocardia sp.]
MTTEQDPTRGLDTEVGELLVHAMSTAKDNGRRDVAERLVVVRDRLEAISDPLGSGVSAQVSPARRTATLRDAAEQIARSFATVESDLRARRAMLEDPSRSARLRAELNNARALQERAATAAKDWQPLVVDGFAALNSDTEYTLRMRMRAVLAEREAAVNTGDPGPLADADTSLRECLVAEAALAYRQMFEAAGEIAVRVAATLGTATPHRFTTLPVVPPTQLVAALAPPRQPRSGTPLAARLLRVVRPGWSGIMMATIAARLLEVKVSNLVLAGLALAGALLLGGAALTGDRKRQLDKRRTDAIAALRGTVEEFRLSLAKQLRDASRALQQELRREAGTTAARAVAAAAADLDTVRRTVEGDRRSADELARIAGDLVTFGERRRRALELGAVLALADAAARPDTDPDPAPPGSAGTPERAPHRVPGRVADAPRAIRRLHVVA